MVVVKLNAGKCCTFLLQVGVRAIEVDTVKGLCYHPMKGVGDINIFAPQGSGACECRRSRVVQNRYLWRQSMGMPSFHASYSSDEHGKCSTAASTRN